MGRLTPLLGGKGCLQALDPLWDVAEAQLDRGDLLVHVQRFQELVGCKVAVCQTIPRVEEIFLVIAGVLEQPQERLLQELRLVEVCEDVGHTLCHDQPGNTCKQGSLQLSQGIFVEANSGKELSLELPDVGEPSVAWGLLKRREHLGQVPMHMAWCEVGHGGHYIALLGAQHRSNLTDVGTCVNGIRKLTVQDGSNFERTSSTEQVSVAALVGPQARRPSDKMSVERRGVVEVTHRHVETKLMPAHLAGLLNVAFPEEEVGQPAAGSERQRQVTRLLSTPGDLDQLQQAGFAITGVAAQGDQPAVSNDGSGRVA